MRVGPAGRIAVVLVAAAVGFLAVGQLRTQERFTQRLEAESEGDLARILASLDAESAALRDEIDAIEDQLRDLESSTQRDAAAERTIGEQLEALAVLAGTVSVEGEGVEVRIADPRGTLGYESLIDVVQELRDAGAEALAVNGQRVGASSAFAEREGRVVLDGEPLVEPYRVTAIGPPETLEGGLAIPGGAVDTLSASQGVDVEVSRRDRVVLPALARSPAFRVARPVASQE